MSVEAQIKILDELIDYLNRRREELKKALEDLKAAEEANWVTVDLNPPVSSEDRLIVWLENKVLKPHVEKHGVKYELNKVDGKVNKIKLANVDKTHQREIENCVKWVCRKASQGERR